jgi:hypothetical protein
MAKQKNRNTRETRRKKKEYLPKKLETNVRSRGPIAY